MFKITLKNKNLLNVCKFSSFSISFNIFSMNKINVIEKYNNNNNKKSAIEYYYDHIGQINSKQYLEFVLGKDNNNYKTEGKNYVEKTKLNEFLKNMDREERNKAEEEIKKAIEESRQQYIIYNTGTNNGNYTNNSTDNTTGECKNTISTISISFQNNFP